MSSALLLNAHHIAEGCLRYFTYGSLAKMDEIADIVRQVGRQQGENAYYRACYALLKRLQELTSQASNDLLRLH